MDLNFLLGREWSQRDRRAKEPGFVTDPAATMYQEKDEMVETS